MHCKHWLRSCDRKWDFDDFVYGIVYICFGNGKRSFLLNVQRLFKDLQHDTMSRLQTWMYLGTFGSELALLCLASDSLLFHPTQLYVDRVRASIEHGAETGRLRKCNLISSLPKGPYE